MAPRTTSSNASPWSTGGIDTREVLTWLPSGPDPAAELHLAAREWARELGQRLDRL